MENQTSDKHKKLSIILAFALPVVLLVGVFISSNVSLFGPSTQYDFVYALCDWQDNGNYYRSNCESYLNEVVKVDEEGNYYRGEASPTRDSDHDGVLDKDEGHEIHFFYHDSEANETREILEKDMDRYIFSPLISSPDGASVEYGYNSSPDFLFMDLGSSGYEFELVQGGRRKTLNTIEGTSYRYYRRDNFEFVGWVINQK